MSDQLLTNHYLEKKQQRQEMEHPCPQRDYNPRFQQSRGCSRTIGDRLQPIFFLKPNTLKFIPVKIKESV